MKLSEALAEELGLTEPDLPWHTQRDRIAEMGAIWRCSTGSWARWPAISR